MRGCVFGSRVSWDDGHSPLSLIFCRGGICWVGVARRQPGARKMQRRLVLPLLAVWLVLAGSLFPAVFSDAVSPDVELPIGRQHRADLETGAEDAAAEHGGVETRSSVRGEDLGLPDRVVSAWNEQVLELDELTRCIRSSEAGDAVERWLACLASLEEAPNPAAASALKPSPTLATLQSGATTDPVSGDAELNASLQLADDGMAAFDPLSVSSSRTQTSVRFDQNSDELEGLGLATEDASAGEARERFSDESENSKAAALSKDEGSGAEPAASSGRSGDGGVETGGVGQRESDASAAPEKPSGRIPSEDDGSAGEGGTRGAPDVRRSSSKWGNDFSSVFGDSPSLLRSVRDDDGGRLEVPAESPGSTASRTRSQNLLDALKLAACLGAAATLIWRKRGRLLALGKEKQSVLSEGAVEYPRPSTTGFSMTARSSSNSDVGYPAVRAGSLSTPLGMAIATVMAEQALQQEHGEGAPRSADELSKLLEAAMTESLSPVMGSECPGFVEQFKQSFRSTYRLLGSVRNASTRSPAPPSMSNRNGGISRRRSEEPSRRYLRQAEDESSGLTSFSRAAYLDPVLESDCRLRSRVDADSESDLAGQLSRLSFSPRRPDAGAHSRHAGSVPLWDAKGGVRDGGYSRHPDQAAAGELDDVSSPLRRDTSEGLSENGSGGGGSEGRRNGARRRWGRGGLEQLADVGGAEGVASPWASESLGRQQGGSSLERGELELAVQPFGISLPGQLVAASESSVSHLGGESQYKQQKIVLMQQEMHLRKMELAYKFRDLSLKEAGLHLSSESNGLMRENVDLSRNKVEFREAEFLDRKLAAGYTTLAARCADEMVAGLCVMLCALFFGAWKYSYHRLVDAVSVCQPTLYEPSNSYVPGFNKIVNSLNHLTSRLHMFACEVTVASRMFLGLGIISVVAASLLRKSVTGNSQAMPATILIVVMGGLCGLAGKFAVDSMGGSGLHWVLLWEAFCLVHATATCFTPTLYRVLYGSPPSATGKRHRQPYLMRPWWRRFWFHVFTVLVLPVLTGLLPFARVREIVEVLGWHLWNLTYSPVETYVRKNYRFSLV